MQLDSSSLSDSDLQLIRTTCRNVLKKFRVRHDPDDFLGYGWQGLNEAHKSYDESRPWEAFAACCITRRVIDQIRRQMPRSPNVNRMIEIYSQALLRGAEPDEAIAEATLRRSRKNIFLFLAAIADEDPVEPDSIDNPAQLSPRTEAIYDELHNHLGELSEIDPEAHTVVVGRFFEGRLRREMATGLDLSLGGVYKALERGIRVLRGLYQPDPLTTESTDG